MFAIFTCELTFNVHRIKRIKVAKIDIKIPKLYTYSKIKWHSL